jgi:hypothetical protein
MALGSRSWPTEKKIEGGRKAKKKRKMPKARSMWAERSERSDRSDRSERYAEYAEPRDVKKGLGRALDFGEPGEPDYFLANSQSLMDAVSCL